MLGQTSASVSEHDRLQLMFERAPGFMALVEPPDLKIGIANEAFLDFVGRRSLLGKPLAEALPEFDVQGIDDILNGVARSGQPFVGRARSSGRTGRMKRRWSTTSFSRVRARRDGRPGSSSKATMSPKTGGTKRCEPRTAGSSS